MTPKSASAKAPQARTDATGLLRMSGSARAANQRRHSSSVRNPPAAAADEADAPAPLSSGSAASDGVRADTAETAIVCWPKVLVTTVALGAPPLAIVSTGTTITAVAAEGGTAQPARQSLRAASASRRNAE